MMTPNIPERANVFDIFAIPLDMCRDGCYKSNRKAVEHVDEG